MLGFSEKLLPPRDIGLVGCPDLGSLNKYIIMFLGFYTIARIRFRSYRHLQKGTAETTHIYIKGLDRKEFNLHYTTEHAHFVRRNEIGYYERQVNQSVLSVPRRKRVEGLEVSTVSMNSAALSPENTYLPNKSELGRMNPFYGHNNCPDHALRRKVMCSFKGK